MKRAVPLHEDKRCATARRSFRMIAGQKAERARKLLIRSLPTVQWKGRTLYTIRCTGTTGKGPHDVNVPESLLWSLIDPHRYRCPYHA